MSHGIFCNVAGKGIKMHYKARKSQMENKTTFLTAQIINLWKNLSKYVLNLSVKNSFSFDIFL